MQKQQVDVAIIGAGTAGLSAWRAARMHTPNAVLVDPGPYGTTCARVGCMPSKLLIAAAEAAHEARHASRFGVDVGGVRIDGERVMARVRSERDRFVGFVLDDMQQQIPAEHLLRGRARFVAEHTLQVEGEGLDRTLHADRIVIATGSRPDVPEAWRAALGELLIVNDDVFDWTTLPRSVAVIGAGVIGLELGQALHRLGVRVRILARGRGGGPLSDALLAELAARHFETVLPLHRSAELIDMRRDRDEAVLRWRTPEGEHEERFERVLASSGRRPNLEGLALEASGLPLDARGRPARPALSTLQIGNSRVFLAGDAAAERPLLHEAADEGRIAGDNAGRWPDVLAQHRRTPLTVMFSEPQIMLTGRSQRSLVESGVAFATGAVSFANQGRSRVIGRNVGALHVYGERNTRRLLGAEMVGPAAEHLGHLLAWSIQRADTVDACLEQPFYHPVIEEGLRTALRELRVALDARPPCEECTPGD